MVTLLIDHAGQRRQSVADIGGARALHHPPPPSFPSSLPLPFLPFPSPPLPSIFPSLPSLSSILTSPSLSLPSPLNRGSGGITPGKFFELPDNVGEFQCLLDTKLNTLLHYVFCLSHRNFKQVCTFAEAKNVFMPYQVKH